MFASSGHHGPSTLNHNRSAQACPAPGLRPPHKKTSAGNVHLGQFVAAVPQSDLAWPVAYPYFPRKQDSDERSEQSLAEALRLVVPSACGKVAKFMDLVHLSTYAGSAYPNSALSAHSVGKTALALTWRQGYGLQSDWLGRWSVLPFA